MNNPATSGLISEMVSYRGTRNEVRAYLARPKTGEPRPAIIVIHEIWGLVDHVKDVANRFAMNGYVALAPDLYSSDQELSTLLTPSNIGATMGFMQTLPMEKRADAGFVQQELSKQPAERREIIQKLMGKMFGGMPKEALARETVGAVDYLNSQSYVKQGKIGSVGFCFGGGMSIDLACHAKTAACVVFYGDNPSPIELVEKIQCPVFGIYAGEDMRINPTLDKLVAAMVRYKKDFEMKIYPGVPHAFFNETNKLTYRAEAASDAWDRSLSFFNRTLS